MDIIKRKKTAQNLLSSKILRMKPWPKNTEVFAKWISADSLWKWERTCLIRPVLTFWNHVSLIFIPWNNKRGHVRYWKTIMHSLAFYCPSLTSMFLSYSNFKIKVRLQFVLLVDLHSYSGCASAPVKLQSKKISTLFLALVSLCVRPERWQVLGKQVFSAFCKNE